VDAAIDRVLPPKLRALQSQPVPELLHRGHAQNRRDLYFARRAVSKILQSASDADAQLVGNAFVQRSEARSRTGRPPLTGE
jgi:hypothetical protein